MSWRKELRLARFRGLDFHALDLSRAEGNRLAVHEFPQRAEHLVEELGRKPRTFTLRGFIAGDNYQDVRDALAVLLATPGAGDLYHPWRGVLTVYAQDWTITDSSDSGGSCTIDIAFVEAQALTLPLIVIQDAPAQAQISADAAVAASSGLEAETNDAMTGGDLPPVYRTQLGAALAAQDAVWAELLGIPAGWLYSDDLDLALAFAALVDVPSSRPLLRAVMGPLAASSPSAGGRADSIAADAFAAAMLAARVAMLARASVLVIDATFATAAEATEVLGMFAGAFEAVRPSAPDEVDDSLAELQTIVTDTLSDAIERSPRIATVTVADTTPAMILAWELYGDVAREDEIIRLNAVGNPATLRGDYQVLT